MSDIALKLPMPALMLVTDRRLAGGEDALVRAAGEAVAGGVNVVQLREKDLPRRELAGLARRLREVTAGKALLVLNTAVDVALEEGADGVHLPEDAEMPRRPRPGFIVGRSVHSRQAAERAAREGVDYVVAGPVYRTRSHPGATALGVDGLREIVSLAGPPVIGIGGITASNAPAVMAAGAAGVAVISAILGATCPRERAADLWRAIQMARPPVAGARPR